MTLRITDLLSLFLGCRPVFAKDVKKRDSQQCGSAIIHVQNSEADL
jgi:hypothetical protein